MIVMQRRSSQSHSPAIYNCYHNSCLLHCEGLAHDQNTTILLSHLESPLACYP